MTDTRLNITAATQVSQLISAPALVGVKSPHIKLSSADGTWQVQVPAAHFIPCPPGETVVCTISIVRVAVEELPNFSGIN